MKRSLMKNIEHGRKINQTITCINTSDAKNRSMLHVKFYHQVKMEKKSENEFGLMKIYNDINIYNQQGM